MVATLQQHVLVKVGIIFNYHHVDLDCSDYLVPEMVIQFQKGDFCETPVALKLASLGSTSGTAIVNCHSIGEGFGENGSNMGCLVRAKWL
jgi:hypothetical protein